MCFKRPIFGLYAYYFSLYLYAPGQWWGHALPSLRWSLIAGVVTLFSIIINRQYNKNWIQCPESKLFFIFFCYVILQLIWVEFSSLHYAYVVLAFKFLILMIIIHSTIKTEKDIMSIIIVNLLGCAYWGYIGFNSVAGGRFEHIGTPGMDDGNLLGIHVLPILVAGSYLLMTTIGKSKYLLIIPITLTLNLIFLTQSRGAIVAMALGVILSIFFVPKESKTQFKIYFVLAIVVGGALIGPAVIERMELALNSQDESGELTGSTGSRVVIIKAQIEMWKENPVLGFGHLGTLIQSPYYIAKKYLANDSSTSGQALRGSHNLTMTMFVDHGLLGGSLYLFIFYFAFKRIFILKVKDISRAEVRNISIILGGLIVGLFVFFVSSQSANSKKLEIDILFIALIPIAYNLLLLKIKKSQKIKT
jgi:hypothetical protein